MRIVYTIVVVCDEEPSTDRAELLDDDLAASLEDAVAASLFEPGRRFAITSSVRCNP